MLQLAGGRDQLLLHLDCPLNLPQHRRDLFEVEQGTGLEFWLARELQTVLGYDKWENFSKVIEKAVTSCTAAGYQPADHFLEARKMVSLGSGAQREIADYMLTRYACYLIAQNGDPSKEPIAFAQVERRLASEQKKIPKQAGGSAGEIAG